MSNLSAEIERKTIQGEEDPKHHLKATAQPGGHAAGAGEYSNCSHVLMQKPIENIDNFYTAATQSSQFKFLLFVLFCYTGDAGKVEAPADLLKSLLKGESPGLHLLEGWCIV